MSDFVDHLHLHQSMQAIIVNFVMFAGLRGYW